MTDHAANRPTRRALLGGTIGVATLVLMAGCTPIHRHHGYVPTDDDLSTVVIGQTNEAELMTLLGSPSAQGLLTGSGWFYVGSKYRHFGAMKPQEVERQVVAISFDSQGTVANVERFGMERGRVVVLSRRVTDPGVSGMSALRQLLGNIGNITAGQVID